MRSKKIYLGILVLIMLFISVPVEAMESDNTIETSEENRTAIDNNSEKSENKDDILIEEEPSNDTSIIYSEPKEENSSVLTNDALNGWSYEDGNTYYYVNGEKVHGFYDIDGKTYFFGITTGKLLTGWQELSEGRFYLYSDGTVKQGWQEIEGKKYYVKDNYILRGFHEIEGKTYFFGITKGALLTGWQELSEGRFYLYSDGTVKQGWQEIEGKKYYVKDNYILRGFHEIEGKTYFFGITKGALLTGWQELSEGRFYLYSDGTVKEGWQEIEGKTYYVRDNYVLRGFHEIEGKTYFFGITKGALLTGWQELSEGRFYLYSDGTVKEGWQEIEGKTYYVRDNYVLRGKQEVDGLLYKFDDITGMLCEGKQVTNDNKIFFIDKNGNRLYGWQEDSGSKYYVGEDGFAVHGFYDIEGKTYFFGITTAKLLTGWQETNEGRFYLYSDGTVKEGWQEIEGKTYYVRDHYILRGFHNIEGKTYFFGITKGALLTGWQQLDNNIFYLNMDGTVVYGNQAIDGRDYIFNNQGYLQGFTYDNNGNILYYHNPDGSQAKGVQRMVGRYYKFNEITGAFEGYVNQRIVIDVSSHQGTIDWEAVKNSGMVDAVILRLGYASQTVDAQFLRNVSELNRLGIPYTVYLFSYAENAYEASLEADFLINTIKNSPVKIATNIFPIFYDIEYWEFTDGSHNNGYLDKDDYAEIIPTFINKVEEALGIATRVYTNKAYAESDLPESVLPYVTWIAQWGPECTYEGSYNGWQYTDVGSVPGISGNVDMSIFYY